MQEKKKLSFFIKLASGITDKIISFTCISTKSNVKVNLCLKGKQIITSISLLGTLVLYLNHLEQFGGLSNPNFMLFWSKTDPFLSDLRFSCPNFSFKVTQKVIIFDQKPSKCIPDTVPTISNPNFNPFQAKFHAFLVKNGPVFARPSLL